MFFSAQNFSDFPGTNKFCLCQNFAVVRASADFSSTRKFRTEQDQVKPDLLLIGKKFTIVHNDKEVVASIVGFSVGDLGYIVEFENPVPRIWDHRFGDEQRTWIMTEENIFSIDRASESSQHTGSSGSTPTRSDNIGLRS